VSLPFSYALFLHQWQESGIYYFILLAVSHLGLFFTFWQDFVFSILEALPIMPLVALLLNIVVLLFTLRLFFHKKAYLLKYLTYGTHRND
ncbi:MAG: hypothetical protein ACHQVK_01365, partial [Candidatus Paceibacterales bacterium]